MSAYMIRCMGGSEDQSADHGVTDARITLAAAKARREGFTNEQFRELNKVDRDIAYREIQELVGLGVVVTEGARRGAVYRLSPDLHATRAWLEGNLPVLRKFFQTHEALKNADYRQLFSVPRTVATRELSRLSAQHHLTLEGERRGAHDPIATRTPENAGFRVAHVTAGEGSHELLRGRGLLRRRAPRGLAIAGGSPRGRQGEPR